MLGRFEDSMLIEHAALPPDHACCGRQNQYATSTLSRSARL
jgi:hypothetical protein